MAWLPRMTAPDVSNMYYRHTGYLVDGVDGLNECIVIDSSTGFVMPNCVGYAWGRWYEALGERPRLYRGDAQDWYYNTGDGYQRGRTPQVGAIACYSGGNYGGHVAVVEQMTGGGAVPITSNSAYNGTLFWTEALIYDGETDSWLPPYSGYTFQGFIYPPFLPPDRKPIWLIAGGNRRLPNGRNKNLHLWR